MTTHSPQSGADRQALDYNPLSYSDPVGDLVVARMRGQDFTLTAENGIRIHVRWNDISPIFDRAWTYKESRKGYVWAGLKKEARDLLQQITGEDQNRTAK